jgi:cytoskeletal protein CcmA (bactofilin family)
MNSTDFEFNTDGNQKGGSMLKRGKKDENDSPSDTSTPMSERIIPSTQKPSAGQGKTIIGENITIEGSIRGEENLVIEGALKGNIEMEKHNFTVGSKGRVDGEIRAQNVSISGELKGNITALGKVEITKDADFYGEIKAKSISVEDGAYFKGMIELDREPHRKSSEGTKLARPSGLGSIQGPTSKPVDAKKET